MWRGGGILRGKGRVSGRRGGTRTWRAPYWVPGAARREEEEEKEEEEVEAVRVSMGGLFKGSTEEEEEEEEEEAAAGATVLLENVSWWWRRLRGRLVCGDCRGQTPVFCALQRVYKAHMICNYKLRRKSCSSISCNEE